MLYAEGGTASTFRHDTKEGAKREAERLAVVIAHLEHDSGDNGHGLCRRFLLTVRVSPFYGELLSAVDEDTSESVDAATVGVSQDELNQRAAECWADEEGR
jgi:hypothetical protein